MLKRLPYAALIAAVVLLGAGLVWLAATHGPPSSESRAATTTQSQQGIGVDLSRRDADDPRAIGAVDAPVVLIEYSDFRCPFCAVHARDTQPKLKKYVDDGTLRVEFHDLSIFGGQSDRAAEASRAAAAQGKFWQFHDAVFADAPARGHADLPDSVLMTYAQKIGVKDLEKFRTDMDAEKTAAAVQADTRAAYDIGASSTPLFLVNDEPILGAQPADVFIEKIERLASAS